MRKSVLIHIVSGGTEFKSTAVFIPYKVCLNNSVLCCIRSWTPPGRCSSTSPHVREYGCRNPGNFFMWNQESGRILLVESGILAATLQSGIQLKEFGVLLKNGIQNPSSIKKTKIQNPRLSRIPLHEPGPVKQAGLLYRPAFPVHSNVVKSTLTRQLG